MSINIYDVRAGDDLTAETLIRAAEQGLYDPETEQPNRYLHFWRAPNGRIFATRWGTAPNGKLLAIRAENTRIQIGGGEPGDPLSLEWIAPGWRLCAGHQILPLAPAAEDLNFPEST